MALRLNAGDVAGAEDVVHDAWIRAVERLSGFRWESAFSTWLSGFVINTIRDRSRKDARELPGIEEEHPSTDISLLKAADRIDLQRALAQLPAGFRQVLILHDIEGYTHEEIAELLGIMPGTSKSQLARARGAVRRALSPKEN